ncbi:tyrosine decarboxylase 1-like [Gossypium australe]|uniref:Tyrosine decarboxylase 1-like n=1 Tax=Gossypium australe TaxID=47621 RepID=A0A5B6V8P9_9ROSI|nr:tyrosine decarboxylase 1-like [Gossypium australe]
MNVYGFLGARKRILMRSLNNIQKAIDHFPSSQLTQKELEVRDELENVLDHEDLFGDRRLVVTSFIWMVGIGVLIKMSCRLRRWNFSKDSMWDTLGGDVCQWVKQVFAGRQIEQELNNMLIVLIPKKENPEYFI